MELYGCIQTEPDDAVMLERYGLSDTWPWELVVGSVTIRLTEDQFAELRKGVAHAHYTLELVEALGEEPPR